MIKNTKKRTRKRKKSNRAQKEDGKDEKVEQLKKELKDKELELDQTKATPVQDFWKKDLQNFLIFSALDKMEEEEAKGLEDATHHSNQIANKKRKMAPKQRRLPKEEKPKGKGRGKKELALFRNKKRKKSIDLINLLRLLAKKRQQRLVNQLSWISFLKKAIR